MVELSISDISKKPSLLDDLNDVAKIVNKKTGEAKGIFIPMEESAFFKKLIEEIEYRKWLERNKGLAAGMDDPHLFDEIIAEIGEKL